MGDLVLVRGHGVLEVVDAVAHGGEADVDTLEEWLAFFVVCVLTPAVVEGEQDLVELVEPQLAIDMPFEPMVRIG